MKTGRTRFLFETCGESFSLARNLYVLGNSSKLDSGIHPALFCRQKVVPPKELQKWAGVGSEVDRSTNNEPCSVSANGIGERVVDKDKNTKVRHWRFICSVKFMIALLPRAVWGPRARHPWRVRWANTHFLISGGVCLRPDGRCSTTRGLGGRGILRQAFNDWSHNGI